MADNSTDPGNKSAAELERDVNRERAQVSSTIDALQEKLSVNSMVEEVVGAVTQHGGDFGRTLGRTARDHPLPLILTGVGLAWLMASAGTPPRSSRPALSDGRDDIYGDRYMASPKPFPPTTTTDPYAGEAADPYGASANVSRTAGASSYAPSSYGSGSSDEGPGLGERLSDAASAVGERVSHAADSVRDRARSLTGRAEERWDRASSRMDDRYRSGSSRARSAYDAGSDRLHDLRDTGRAYADSARSRLSDLLDEHPLAVGAVAIAIGAAIGGALPRTRREDELVGARSDALAHDLEDRVSEEAGKLQAVAGAVIDEGRQMSREAMSEAEGHMPSIDDAASAIKTRARDAADRLSEAAEDEAGRQNLGASAEKPVDVPKGA